MTATDPLLKSAPRLSSRGRLTPVRLWSIFTFGRYDLLLAPYRGR